MILDERAEFCDATAATGSGVSVILGDVIDRQAETWNTLIDLGTGEPVYLVIQVTTSFSGGTSAAFALKSDSTANLATSATTHLDTGAIGVGSLLAGTVIVRPLPMEKTYERYVGMWLTTVGAVSAGAINAFLTKDVNRWASYYNAIPAGV